MKIGPGSRTLFPVGLEQTQLQRLLRGPMLRRKNSIPLIASALRLSDLLPSATQGPGGLTGWRGKRGTGWLEAGPF